MKERKKKGWEIHPYKRDPNAQNRGHLWMSQLLNFLTRFQASIYKQLSSTTTSHHQSWKVMVLLTLRGPQMNRNTPRVGATQPFLSSVSHRDLLPLHLRPKVNHYCYLNLGFLINLHAVVEVAERFAFYSMVGNLIIYLTDELHEPITMATKNFYNWSGASYIFPLFGAFIADSFLGRFKTIILSSIIYCMVSF